MKLFRGRMTPPPHHVTLLTRNTPKYSEVTRTTSSSTKPPNQNLNPKQPNDESTYTITRNSNVTFLEWDGSKIKFVIFKNDMIISSAKILTCDTCTQFNHQNSISWSSEKQNTFNLSSQALEANGHIRHRMNHRTTTQDVHHQSNPNSALDFWVNPQQNHQNQNQSKKQNQPQSQLIPDSQIQQQFMDFYHIRFLSKYKKRKKKFEISNFLI